MEVHCYVCHNKTKNWTPNLVEIKSKHSRTPIAKFLTKFLADYPTERNLYHHANCICNDCLSKIYSYDWTCIKAKEQESELRNLLLKTESVIKSLQFVGGPSAVTPEEMQHGPMNPLNGVVHIIDAEDYNNDDQMDDKVNVKAEMEIYSAAQPPPPPSAAAAVTAAEPEIQMAPVRKKSANVDIKPDPTTMCDIKPTIENQATTTLSEPQPQLQKQQQQQQPTNVTPKTEPIKKGKPIIVRVVKRVPFLKANASNATAQPNTAPTTSTSAPSSTNGKAATKETPKTSAKTSPAKKTATAKQIPVCKYCDGRFPNEKILQVCQHCSTLSISNS